MGVTIPQGSYQVREHLTIQLKNSLSYNSGTTTAIIGPNGVGKSSFLEKVVVPAILESSGTILFFMQQNFEIQWYSITARSVDIKQKTRKVYSMEDALTYIAKVYSTELESEAFTAETPELYLVLDEPAQYWESMEWLAPLVKWNPALITITHLLDEFQSRWHQPIFLQELRAIGGGVTEVLELGSRVPYPEGERGDPS